MSVSIKSLKRGQLSNSDAELYPVPSGKATIIKNIRLVNTGANAVTVNLYFKRGSDTAVRILPKDVSIAPGAMLIDDDEITMEYIVGTPAIVDAIRGVASATNVIDYVISGVERDA